MAGLCVSIRTMKELWTASVELHTPPSETGDTKCFTNVVAWAEDREGYASAISSFFKKSNCFVLAIKQCIRITDCTDIPEELQGQIERAKAYPEDCVLGTLHYYPSKPA